MSLVNAYLLDVNVLLAYALPGHTDHGKAYRWFKEIGSKRFCTCAMTQSGFIRLLSNPAIYLERVSMRMHWRSSVASPHEKNIGSGRWM